MNVRRIAVLAVAALCLYTFEQAGAQEPEEEDDVSDASDPADAIGADVAGAQIALATIANLLATGVSQPGTLSRTSDDVLATVRNTLEAPETQSRLLNTYLTGDHGWQFLRDVNFKFKAFEADAANETALGFSYDYQKSLDSYELSCDSDACARGLDLNLAANGNVAFDSERNPNDFLETALSFAYFQSTGGARRAGQEGLQRFRELRREFIAAETEEEEEAIVHELEQLVRPLLTDQFYWEVAADASLESDQKFSSKQWVYGVHAVFEMKGWSKDSPIAKFNIFDYPFAALRALTGYEECDSGGSACFVPRGTAWPTALVGLARVSPDSDDPRALAGDTSDFDRLKFEAAFRTPIARLGDDRLYVSVNYRYYEELDPSPVVRSLDIDAFEYYTVVLGGSDGLYVSYTEGKLPLDVADDRVFELGYQLHL
jgi:hypothetical protein